MKDEARRRPCWLHFGGIVRPLGRLVSTLMLAAALCAASEVGAISYTGPTKIYFTSTRGAASVTTQSHVWRMNPDGSILEQVTYGNQYDFKAKASRDGRKLAIARRASPGSECPQQLWIRDLASGLETQINVGSSDGVHNMEWSPDGTQIAYTLSPGCSPPQSVKRITVYPTVGTPVHVAPSSGEAASPTWSADGQSNE